MVEDEIASSACPKKFVAFHSQGEPMEYREIGRAGMKVSVLCLGTIERQSGGRSGPIDRRRSGAPIGSKRSDRSLPAMDGKQTEQR